MATDLEYPWFPEVMELLDARRRDRVLMITAHHPRDVEAVLQCVGGQGDVLVVEPSRKHATEVVETIPQVEVMAMTPTGEEVFGRFDALLACPLGMPDWPLQLWANIARSNLRPGGRFAIDLPGEELCEVISSCWTEIHGGPDNLLPLRGPGEQTLASSLRQEGLRMVAAAVGTHLVRVDSPHTLAGLGAGLLRADRDQREELGIALTRRLRTTGPVEVVFHRTRVHGIR